MDRRVIKLRIVIISIFICSRLFLIFAESWVYRSSVVNDRFFLFLWHMRPVSLSSHLNNLQVLSRLFLYLIQQVTLRLLKFCWCIILFNFFAGNFLTSLSLNFLNIYSSFVLLIYLCFINLRLSIRFYLLIILIL